MRMIYVFSKGKDIMSKAKADKIELVTSHDVSLDKEYVEWLQELKTRFRL